MFDSDVPSALPELALPTPDMLDAPETQSATDTPLVTPVTAYVERWKQGLRVVLGIPLGERRENFSMGNWGYQTACGTVACFAGHCSLDDWFRAQGFTSQFVKDPESGVEQLSFTGIGPEQFFGSGGQYGILLDTDLDYDQLVTAVRDHIAYLQHGGDPDSYVYRGDQSDDGADLRLGFLPGEVESTSSGVDPDNRLERDWAPFVERWEHALQVLLDMPPHQRETHLDMELWGVLTPCGTVACLGGHCSLNPWFRAQGFTSVFERHPQRGEMELKFTGIDPEDFFGAGGFNTIFMATGLKYDQLVSAVRDQIAFLKAGGDPNGHSGLGAEDFILVWITVGEDNEPSVEGDRENCLEGDNELELAPHCLITTT